VAATVVLGLGLLNSYRGNLGYVGFVGEGTQVIAEHLAEARRSGNYGMSVMLPILGAIEGVAGPEAANNSAAAGVLVPLLTLGLPTSATAAIMLAADEPMKMTRCNSDSHQGCMATRARCLTHDLWEGLSSQIQLYLGSIMLSDVCDRKVQEKFPRAHAIPELMMFAKGVASRQSPVTSYETATLDAKNSLLKKKSIQSPTGDWRLTTVDL
jgi:hypothetical protein